MPKLVEYMLNNDGLEDMSEVMRQKFLISCKAYGVIPPPLAKRQRQAEAVPGAVSHFVDPSDADMVTPAHIL